MVNTTKQKKVLPVFPYFGERFISLSHVHGITTRGQSKPQSKTDTQDRQYVERGYTKRVQGLYLSYLSLDWLHGVVSRSQSRPDEQTYFPHMHQSDYFHVVKKGLNKPLRSRELQSAGCTCNSLERPTRAHGTTIRSQSKPQGKILI